MAEANLGLLVSIKRLLSTLVSVASTRLQLLANELEEERLHWERMLLCFLATLFCFGMALMLLTVLVVALFWDTHRLAVLGGAGGLFLLAGILLTSVLLRMKQRKSTLFSVSLAEMAKDSAELAGNNAAP
jgi:uncharacterized membrane protein YqjE